MGVIREVTYPVLGWVGSFNSASTFIQTYTTVHVVNSATTYYGVVIDRQALGTQFDAVDVSLSLQSTVGSTETGNSTPRGISVAVWLQHGASSGGGDMAALSPPLTYANSNFYTTLDTTDMAKYSTGVVQGGITAVNTFDLNGAYRFVRSAFSVTRTISTTCTDNIDGAYLANMLIFRGGQTFPTQAKAPLQASTSTTT